MGYDNHNKKFDIEELLKWLDTKHVKVDHLRELFDTRVVKVAVDHLLDWTEGRSKPSTRKYVVECADKLKKLNDADDKLDPRRTLKVYRTLENIRRARIYRELPV